MDLDTSTSSDISSAEDKKSNKVCHICGDVAKSMHFGGVCCDSCKAFFRRSVQNEAYCHFRCGGEKKCVITIASRKFCKYCRFRQCEESGMIKDWVMNEQERQQLMKSRLTKKFIETGDEDALRDTSLYTTYEGRVALTAGGAPNLHGLNRRRHMECKMREEGEVDPRIYGSAAKKQKSDSQELDEIEAVSKRLSLHKKKPTTEGAPKRGRPRKNPIIPKTVNDSYTENSFSKNRKTAKNLQADLQIHLLTPSPSPEQIKSHNFDFIPDNNNFESDNRVRYNERIGSDSNNSDNMIVPCSSNVNDISDPNLTSLYEDNMEFIVSDVLYDIINSTDKSMMRSLNKENSIYTLSNYPKEPQKYEQMLVRRPGKLITHVMSREDLVMLAKIIKTMQKTEERYPYCKLTDAGVMELYVNFITRVTFFLGHFSHFNSLETDEQNRIVMKNMTVIALVFGSSFANESGMYKNVMKSSTNPVTNMNEIGNVLTSSVFGTFKVIHGVLSQFKVDIRMGYILIFAIIFNEDKYAHLSNYYRNLLHKYICWKYGEENAEHLRLNLYDAIDKIRKQAYIFETMTANTKDVNVEKVKTSILKVPKTELDEFPRDEPMNDLNVSSENSFQMYSPRYSPGPDYSKRTDDPIQIKQEDGGNDFMSTSFPSEESSAMYSPKSVDDSSSHSRSTEIMNSICDPAVLQRMQKKFGKDTMRNLFYSGNIPQLKEMFRECEAEMQKTPAENSVDPNDVNRSSFCSSTSSYESSMSSPVISQSSISPSTEKSNSTMHSESSSTDFDMSKVDGMMKKYGKQKLRDMFNNRQIDQLRSMARNIPYSSSESYESIPPEVNDSNRTAQEENTPHVPDLSNKMSDMMQLYGKDKLKEMYQSGQMDELKHMSASGVRDSVSETSSSNFDMSKVDGMMKKYGKEKLRDMFNKGQMDQLKSMSANIPPSSSDSYESIPSGAHDFIRSTQEGNIPHVPDSDHFSVSNKMSDMMKLYGKDRLKEMYQSGQMGELAHMSASTFGVRDSVSETSSSNFDMSKVDGMMKKYGKEKLRDMFNKGQIDQLKSMSANNPPSSSESYESIPSVASDFKNTAQEGNIPNVPDASIKMNDMMKLYGKDKLKEMYQSGQMDELKHMSASTSGVRNSVPMEVNSPSSKGNGSVPTSPHGIPDFPSSNVDMSKVEFMKKKYGEDKLREMFMAGKMNELNIMFNKNNQDDSRNESNSYNRYEGSTHGSSLISNYPVAQNDVLSSSGKTMPPISPISQKYSMDHRFHPSLSSREVLLRSDDEYRRAQFRNKEQYNPTGAATFNPRSAYPPPPPFSTSTTNLPEAVNNLKNNPGAINHGFLNSMNLGPSSNSMRNIDSSAAERSLYYQQRSSDSQYKYGPSGNPNSVGLSSSQRFFPGAMPPFPPPLLHPLQAEQYREKFPPLGHLGNYPASHPMRNIPRGGPDPNLFHPYPGPQRYNPRPPL